MIKRLYTFESLKRIDWNLFEGRNSVGLIAKKKNSIFAENSCTDKAVEQNILINN